jgi:hypothetical protein
LVEKRRRRWEGSIEIDVKEGVYVQTGFRWLRTGSSGGFLYEQGNGTLVSIKRWKTSSVDKRMSVCNKGLRCVELFEHA